MTMRLAIIAVAAAFAGAVHAEGAATSTSPAKASRSAQAEKSGYWSPEQMGARARARLKRAAKAVEHALDEDKPASKAGAKAKPQLH